MALLATQRVTQAGLNPSFTAASADNDTFVPGDRTTLRVKAAGTAVTVTVVSQKVCDQGAHHNTVVTVPTNSERVIGPFPGNRYADPDTGLVVVGYSQVTGITVAVIAN
jgi:hypothetical protein